MAEEDDDDLEFEPADAGVAFRAEMAVTNFFLGYWRHIVAVIVVVLLAFLAYGQWDSWYQKSQREASRRIFETEKALRGFEEVPPADELVKVADALVAIASEAQGMARIEAYLKASEFYRLAEQPEKRRSALEAVATDGSGVMAYAAESALANMELEAGDGEAATTRLERLSAATDGQLGQQATLDLAMMYEHLGQTDRARATYNTFSTRFPDSEMGDQVRARLAKLGGEG